MRNYSLNAIKLTVPLFILFGVLGTSDVLALEKIEANIRINAPDGGIRWSTPPGWRDACKRSFDFTPLVSRLAENSLGKLFESALPSAAPPSENEIQVTLGWGDFIFRELQGPSFGVAGQAEMGFSLTAKFALKDRLIWEEIFRVEEKFTFSGSLSCDNLLENLKGALNAGLDKGLQSISLQASKNQKFRTTIEDALEPDTAGSSLYVGLQPLLATYRVTEAEGVIRKKPAAKGTQVRKLGMGSIVQIIGKLPTGWLQVAKEGEAIGWIHEGSVTAMSVQQAPTAVAAAPAKPAAPVKPTPTTVAAVSPAPTSPPVAADAFPTKPVAVSFPRGKVNPDDIAVIIGNANYKNTAKDIPDVVPAYADAEGMKRYASQALGVKDENIIFIKDARLADLIATFGNDSNPKGKLWNWVKAGRSQVFVYYVGHGAPSSDGSSSYLVPVDAQASLIDLSGYSVKTLYSNLGKLPAKNVTVVIEACFSGATQSGMLVKNASPIYQKAQQEIVPENLTVITAGSGNQIASWEQDKSASLFTKHYLLGMAGAADKKPFGNGDGKVDHQELGRYLAETLSYSAQRYYGREQTAQILTSAK